MEKIILEKPDLKPGDKTTIQKKVTEEDTALKYGTGKLRDLLATPSLVGLMIEGSVQLIDKKLPDGFISVGKQTYVDHEKPTIIGENVSVTVEITEIENNRYHLKMTAHDESGIIGHGKHIRTIVNEKWLMLKIKKQKSLLASLNY
ncbi:MAG: thioesterase [Spirochaetia bacterium]|jgi:predicted thioesterase|nr:thioesterase [Spirochaetia bacterium]